VIDLYKGVPLSAALGKLKNLYWELESIAKGERNSLDNKISGARLENTPSLRQE
jgi:hypothetical protein